jgi:Flp pilus assembly protein TadD
MRHRLLHRLAWPTLLGTWLAACGGGDQPGPDTPTFARDIAPIVYRSCTPCHCAGGPTPFELSSYDDVHERRSKIVEMVTDRRMPPWLPTHGDFVGDRRLSPEEITLLQRWVTAGSPRGDATAEPPCPTFPTGWQLRQPDLVVTAPSITVEATGPDQLRNLVVRAPNPAPVFVAAVEIVPDSPAVHHAVLAVDTTTRSRELDAADPAPGFGGMKMGGAKPPDGYFLGWTPGKSVRPLPAGMSWQLPPGADLVLQLHLVPTGRVETVQPRIGLFLAAAPATVVSHPLGLFAIDIDLPAGATDIVVRDHFVTPVAVEVRSIYPHAHYLCRRMVAWVTPPGSERRDLFRIDRWDFDWQDDYTLRSPLALPAGTRIDFEYHYDNSAANPANPFSPPQRVRSGDSSVDEMGNLSLQVTVADHDTRRRLGEAGVRRDLEKIGFDAALLLQLAMLQRETNRLDEAFATIAKVHGREPGNAEAWLEQGHCLAAAGRPDDAAVAYGKCLQFDPAENGARIQLANLELRAGRHAEAIALYDQALARAPDLAPLHNNLATACLAVGQLDRAEVHYRRTLALDAGFFQAWLNLGRTLAATGRLDEARDALRRAKALRPDDARVDEALRSVGG